MADKNLNNPEQGSTNPNTGNSRPEGEQSNALSHVLANKYPQFTGYSKVWEQYGNNPQYKEFFEKLQMEQSDKRVNIILDNKKYSLLAREVEGVMAQYFLQKDAREELKAQGKKMLDENETDAFIEQFPGELGEDDGYSGEHLREKINSLVTLLELEMKGQYNNSTISIESDGTKGAAYIGENAGGNYMEEIRWNAEGEAGKMGASAQYGQPVIAYEDVK